MSLFMLFIFYKTPDQLGPQKNEMNEKGILWGRGWKQKQVVFPTKREEIKCDIPLPTGCWFALLSPSITLCLLDFLIIHLKWKISSFNTGSSKYCFCTIAWLLNADHQKKFGMMWIISLCLENADCILYAYHF